MELAEDDLAADLIRGSTWLVLVGFANVPFQSLADVDPKLDECWVAALSQRQLHEFPQLGVVEFA
jgi:hypothetical protein